MDRGFGIVMSNSWGRTPSDLVGHVAAQIKSAEGFMKGKRLPFLVKFNSKGGNEE